MIARFRVLLPFFFYIREGDTLPPFEVTRGIYRVKFFAPIHSGIVSDELEGDSPITQVQIFERVKNPPQPVFAGLVQIDGARTARANILQLEIQKESFNRRQDSIGNPDNEEIILQSGDPPLREVFDLFNDYIARLRILHRASFAHPISPLDAFWCIQYFNDDGSELTPDPTLFRVRSGGRVRFQLFGVTPAVWDEFKTMPPIFNASPWVVLLLDAGDLLPDLGASIAVSNAALELFSSWFSNELARRSPVPTELWKWINDRGDWYKEPSVAERFDELLKVFTGHSLKEDAVLWKIGRASCRERV